MAPGHVGRTTGWVPAASIGPTKPAPVSRPRRRSRRHPPGAEAVGAQAGDAVGQGRVAQPAGVGDDVLGRGRTPGEGHEARGRVDLGRLARGHRERTDRLGLCPVHLDGAPAAPAKPAPRSPHRPRPRPRTSPPRPQPAGVSVGLASKVVARLARGSVVTPRHRLEGVAQGDRRGPDGLRLHRVPLGAEAPLSRPGAAPLRAARRQLPGVTVPGNRAADRSVTEPSPAALISLIMMTRSRSESAARARLVASWYGSESGCMS